MLHSRMSAMLRIDDTRHPLSFINVSAFESLCLGFCTADEALVCIVRHGNGAATAMDVDSPKVEEVRQRKRDLKDFVRRQKSEAESLRREA